MPHMAPIMWTMIMLMNFLLILTMTSIIYFNTWTMAPKFKMSEKMMMKITWAW
uniref:ATP synthase F0 subunit 8 n=1 Tax=Ashinkailepas seepiophila TaxID=479252 RepID=UPI0021CC61FC|nr:ATP synthase F0 subunit 8 [Ashinkailepas seepiophila]UWM12885.1 ATP synthase F0 subunit 8 [Ashinkailepas seepiophila]